MIKRPIAYMFIFCLVFSCGCSTVKGAAAGFVQDVKTAGKGIKYACNKIADIPGVKKADDKFKEIAW
jgi:hypothetical protein